MNMIDIINELRQLKQKVCERTLIYEVLDDAEREIEEIYRNRLKEYNHFHRDATPEC